jgi:hypothetical protein
MDFFSCGDGSHHLHAGPQPVAIDASTGSASHVALALKAFASCYRLCCVPVEAATELQSICSHKPVDESTVTRDWPDGDPGPKPFCSRWPEEMAACGLSHANGCQVMRRRKAASTASPTVPPAGLRLSQEVIFQRNQWQMEPSLPATPHADHLKRLVFLLTLHFSPALSPTPLRKRAFALAAAG